MERNFNMKNIFKWLIKAIISCTIAVLITCILTKIYSMKIQFVSDFIGFVILAIYFIGTFCIMDGIREFAVYVYNKYRRK